MCEACRDPHVEWEETTRVPAGEEWFCDGEDGPCYERAVWCTRFAMVDEHLCDAHKTEEDEPGLRALKEATGLEEGSYLLAIREPETCNGPLLGPSCDARAMWAHVVIAQAYSCERHRSREVKSPEARL